MSMDYQDYVNTVANIALVNPIDAAFQAAIPTMINYAEMRIYRELNLLETVTRNDSNTLTSNSRTFTVPAEFVVVEGMNVITPETAPSADAGVRNPLTLVTREYLDNIWPSSAGVAVPRVVAQINQSTYVVGPPPDAGYRVEVIGTIRPTPLSPTNTETFLTRHLQDLLIAASMVWVTGYQRNFGAQGNDPQYASSWEGQYQIAFKSANVEELRKKWSADAWTPKQPNPIAEPKRG